mmetsp:Transcript_34916/g.108628  ORF Transcript_34916/g.108628 Transcript_34916/m.108628 type:complete len:291 (-) Transcript_34916:88-960(-)
MQQRWATVLLLALLAQPAFCQGDADEDAMEIPEGEDEGDESAEPSISPEQLQKLHKLMDADGNGKMSLDEILAFSTKTSEAMATKDAGSILKDADTSRDGKMSLEEHLKDFSGGDHEAEDEESKAVMEHQKEVEKAKFAAADVNNDGLLDDKEVPALFFPETHDGVLSIMAKDSLKQKDADGNGVLSFEEFFAHNAPDDGDEPPADTSEQYRDEFARLDKDHDGSITLEEFKAWESGMFHMHESVKSLFKTVDRDGDGHVTAEELANSHGDVASSDAVYHVSSWAEHHEL